MTKRALIIFVKNPVPGKTKTRLAAEVGDEKAMEIYKSLVTHTRKVALEIDVARYVYYADFINDDDEFASKDFNKSLQKGDDLGARMNTAFREILAKHKEVVLIGSDCPGIDVKVLKSAFRKLKMADFAVGPAEDGGYYLLGMKSPESALFLDIEWSTPNVLPKTLNRIWTLGKTYASLEMLSDIDYAKDWEKHLSKIQ